MSLPPSLPLPLLSPSLPLLSPSLPLLPPSLPLLPPSLPPLNDSRTAVQLSHVLLVSPAVRPGSVSTPIRTAEPK
jgi:hypothetical protein